MYRRREDLSQLINAMSATEKRYFINFSKAFVSSESEPLYMKLFSLHEKNESNYSEEDFGKGEKSVIMAKKRLYFNILKSLRLFHQHKSVANTIHNLLCEIEILYNLGLPKQSLHLLKKAYDLANSHEKFGLLLQILEWESQLNLVLDTPTRSQEAIVAEENVVLQKQQQYRILQTLFAKIKVFKKKHGTINSKLNKELKATTIESAEMPTLEKCLSQKATFYYHLIHTVYFTTIFDSKKAFEHSEKLVATHINSLPPDDYINGLLEHITSCVCLGKFDEALSRLRLGKEIIESTNLKQSHAFTISIFAYHCYELIIYNYMGDKKNLEKAIKWVEAHQTQFAHTLSFENKQVIQSNLINSYVGIGDMDRADEIFNNMLNKESATVRRDVYADLYLFRLFRLLYTNTYELLPYATAAALRYYKKFKDAAVLFEIELPITLLLQKDFNYSNKSVRNEVITQIRNIVLTFINNLNLIPDFQEHYTRYIIWCDAMLKEVAYHVAAADWYKEFKVKNEL